MSNSDLTIIAPLGNIQCIDGFSLGRDINIVKTPDYVEQIIGEARHRLLIRTPGPLPYCLVIKLPGAQGISDSEARIILEKVILLLRLYKPGNIYYNFVVLVPGIGIQALQSNPSEARLLSIFFFMGWQQPKLESIYQLTDVDRLPLLDFCTRYREAACLRKRAYTVFFRGYHEPYAEDRFLRNAVGLENLFVNDTKDQSNVRYKFIDRGCYLLQKADPKPLGATEYVNRLRDIYDTRCKLVHSNDEELDWTSDNYSSQLFDSDHFLRITLRMCLDDQALLSSTEVDKRKRSYY